MALTLLLAGKRLGFYKLYFLHQSFVFSYINELFEAGQIKPAIDGPYNLSSAAEAIQHFGEGNHKGKVIITMENEL